MQHGFVLALSENIETVLSFVKPHLYEINLLDKGKLPF